MVETTGIERLQAGLILSQQLLVAALKRLHGIACCTGRHGGQQRATARLYVIVQTGKTVPVVSAAVGILAAQQHVFPFLHLDLEIQVDDVDFTFLCNLNINQLPILANFAGERPDGRETDDG